MHPQQLHVFAFKRHIITSMDFNALPTIPPPINLDSEDWEPFQAMELQWASPLFPQIAFVPRYPNFSTTLFMCLNGGFPTESIDGRWQLAREVQDAWNHLEESLKMATNILMANLTARQIFPLGFAWFPLPQTFGYKRTHRTHKIAVRSAEISRQAFVPLAAMCSFAVAMNLIDEDFHTRYPQWARVLRTGGMHPVWVDNFLSSQFADFVHTERVGSIVHSGCSWLYFVQPMRRAAVPLLFFWEEGNLNSYAKALMGHKVKEFRPSTEHINTARMESSQQHCSFEPSPNQLDHSTSGHSLAQTRAEIPPPPEPHSRQRRGETWQEYFERQCISYEDLKKTESRQARMARESRELEAQRGQCPSKRGAVVWQWLPVNGFLIRQRVSRGAQYEVWNEYSHTQRRFDSFFNAWDLCRAFDPEASLTPDDDDYDPELFPSIALTHVKTDAPPPPPAAVLHCSSSAINDCYSHDDPAEEYFTYWEEPVDWLLYYRYGFHPSSGGSDYHLFDADAFRFTMKTLGVSEGNWKTLAADERPKVVSFIHDLRTGANPPASLWDLRNGNEAALAQRQDHDVVIHTCVTRTGTYFIIDPRYEASTEDASWRIVVRSAATALECLRNRWGQSRYSLARELLVRGISFSTFGRLLSPDVGISPRTSYQHAPREVGYTPDQYDYRQYEAQLREYLLNEDHARVAFLRGGLIWRLAREVVGRELDNQVLLGPSAKAQIHGTRIKLFSKEPEVCDDCLSDVELNFICGVIPILTGNNDQTQEPSWWPKLPLFEKSPLNVGYWSHSCEYWFSQRIEKIRSGELGTTTPSRWKKSLKLWSPTLGLIAGVPLDSYLEVLIHFRHRMQQMSPEQAAFYILLRLVAV